MKKAHTVSQRTTIKALALTIWLFSSAHAVPQKSSSGTLSVPGSHEKGDMKIEVSGHGDGVHMRREVASASADQHTAHSLADRTFARHRQPAGENLTGHPPTLTAAEAADRLEEDGIVDTFNAAADSSKVIKLEEETIECTMDTPVWECMEKHGSYGVRRLFTDSVNDYNKLKNWRKDWMANPEVQRKKLFEVTWPGTHDSGAYGFDPAILETNESGKASVKGAITQHLDVYTQLDLGVRAIEVQIAVSKQDGQLYSANGFLMMSLATILTDIASFLEQHHKEVVLLYMKKADVWNGIELAHIQPLKDEENNPNAIPGESVHKGVQAVIGKHLATYETLKELPATQSAENPAIDAAIAAGIRVFYFWEGQQVLCISKEQCVNTPGWTRGTLGEPLGFGPGLPYGARTNLNRGTGTQTYMEPGCIHSSASATQSTNPIQLLLNVKKYAGGLMNSAKSHPTTCFPSDAAIPEVHTPTLLYEADVWASPYSQAEGAYRQVYKDIKEIYTRGESATLKSEAERVNYLTLNWLFRKNWQPLFSKLNIISMDYISPINVHRIVEANQNRKDCGYAIYCKVTGSCWAQTMLDEEANACREESKVLAFLKWHADGEPWPTWMLILGLVLTAALVKACCLTSSCYLCGNKPCPTCCIEGGVGIVWWKREQKAAPDAGAPLLDEPDAAAQPTQEEMAPEEEQTEAPAF